MSAQLSCVDLVSLTPESKSSFLVILGFPFPPIYIVNYLGLLELYIDNLETALLVSADPCIDACFTVLYIDALGLAIPVYLSFEAGHELNPNLVCSVLVSSYLTPFTDVGAINFEKLLEWCVVWWPCSKVSFTSDSFKLSSNWFSSFFVKYFCLFILDL